MADIRKLYFDLLNDYDPFHENEEVDYNISESQMLYNLLEIKKNNGIENYDNEQEKKIYYRFISLINVMQLLGIKPSL